MTRALAASRALAIAGALVLACANGSTTDDGATLDASAGPPSPPAPLADAARDAPPAPADASQDSPENPADSASGDAAPPPPDAPADAPSFPCAQTIDFEASDGAFTHAAMDGFAGNASWPFDVWAWGAATSGAKCHSGTKCWATNPAGNYRQCDRAELRSPPLDLTTCASATTVKLVFWHAVAFATFNYGGSSWADGGLVEISGDGGQTWQAAPGVTGNGTIAINPDQGSSYSCLSKSSFYVNGKGGFTGATAGWQEVTLTVPPALRTNQFMIRFAYGSGVSSQTTDATQSEAQTAPGWHIDDVQIVAQ